MYKNYFLTAIRNIYRNKVYTIINIIGLATGLSVALLLFIYAQYEYSYDNFHHNSKQIYRVIKDSKSDQEARTGLALAQLLKNEFPEIVKTVRVAYLPEIKLEHQNEWYTEKRMVFSEPEIFDVFSFALAEGDPKTALLEPNSIVITKEIAKKYFGNENPMGKIIGNTIQLKVTGILKDMPDNTHLRFTILASLETLKNWANLKDWEWNGISYTYIMLPANYANKALERKFPAFESKYGIEIKTQEKFHYRLEPLETIHLFSRCFTVLPDLSMRFNDKILYLLIILGLLILIISCINYINVSTARSITRSKEVGIRKVLGATRTQLIKQFLLEFLIITFLTLSFAYVLTELFLPFISSIANRKITISYLHNYQYVAGSVIIAIVIAFISGIYPSFVLSAFNPVKALKSSLKTSKGSIYRKLLTICQFIASIILVITSYFILKNASSYSEGHLGFNQENLIILKMYDKNIRKNYYTLKNEFLKNPDIVGVTASSNELSVSGWNTYFVKSDDIKEKDINYISIDHDYLKTLGIEIKEGRNLNEKIADDNKNSFLVNEEAIKQLEIKDALGRKLELYTKDNETQTQQYEGRIVGITNMFAYRPMYDKLKGVVLSVDSSKFHYAIIRVAAENKKATIEYIQKVWQSFFPSIPFRYTYLKDDIKDDIGIKYLEKAGNLFVFCSFLSISIAILGLFALAMFTTQQRIKEIGIRKIFGTPVINLIFLLSGESLKLMVIANLIAGTFAFWLMKTVVMPQTKQMDFNIGVFIWVALGSLVITQLTILFMVLKTTRTNPVEALRYE